MNIRSESLNNGSKALNIRSKTLNEYSKPNEQQFITIKGSFFNGRRNFYKQLQELLSIDDMDAISEYNNLLQKQNK